MSGAPIGLTLALLAPPLRSVSETGGAVAAAPLAVSVMVLSVAHRVSPMVLAWANPGLRAIVLQEWGKYLILPAVLMLACLVLRWDQVVGLYFAVNGWHFGMQIFGISCLYARPKNVDQRVRRALLIMGLFIAQYVAALFIASPSTQLFLFGAVSFNHWLADIGLSSEASGRRWVFLAAVLAAGAGYCLLIGMPAGWLSRQNLHEHFIWVLRTFMGLGMIHFAYSAGVWKFSDPRVRAAIGRELFA